MATYGRSPATRSGPGANKVTSLSIFCKTASSSPEDALNRLARISLLRGNPRDKRFGKVAQAAEPAVSQVAKPANAGVAEGCWYRTKRARPAFEGGADWQSAKQQTGLSALLSDVSQPESLSWMQPCIS
jgi:hypothetical protein